MERIFKKGDSGKLEKRYQQAIVDRGRVKPISVDGHIGDVTLDAAEDTARIMGVSPYKGSIPAALRRQAVVLGAKRTSAELRRAKRVAKAEREKTPKIVDLRLSFPSAGQNGYQGVLGTLVASVGHYSGGPRDTSDAHAFALWRQYHLFHKSKGWGGEGYHYGITAKGTLVLLRPAKLKGTHVAGYNTGRIGINMHGTTGDRPTAAQAKTLRWLLLNAHTSALPAEHRTTANLDKLKVVGHNDLNSTSCPGSFKPMYLSHGRSR